MKREALRARVRAMADESQREGRPYAWFDKLYRDSGGDSSGIPWADCEPNPHYMEWAERTDHRGGGRALVVGCGLGDDAEELARRGFDVTAIDVSSAAVEWCRRRHAGGVVRYEAQDLFDLSAEYRGAFEFVLEVYTLQSLPLELRASAFEPIAACLAPGGRLLVIARGRGDDEEVTHVPWPMSRRELAGFGDSGLQTRSWEDFLDEEEPPKRRFRALYRRPAAD